MASRHLRLAVGAFPAALFCMTLASAAMAENAITTDVASVRAGPDDSYPEVAQLDADSPIEVMGCLDDWSWCDVTFDGNRGWLYSPDITYEYEGGYVPFYTYAPAFSVPVISFTVDTYWGRYYHDRPWYRDREQWSHRVIQHRPPPGPRPHSGPPPREAVRMDRPHGGPPGDRSTRSGRAEPRPTSHEPSRDERNDRNEHHERDRAAPERDRAAPERSNDHEAAGSAAHERPQPERAAPQRTTPDHRDHVAPPHEAPSHETSPHETSPHEASPREASRHEASTHEASANPAPSPMHAPPEHPAPQHEARAPGRPEGRPQARPEAQHAEPPHREEPRPQSNKPQP